MLTLLVSEARYLEETDWVQVVVSDWVDEIEGYDMVGTDGIAGVQALPPYKHMHMYVCKYPCMAAWMRVSACLSELQIRHECTHTDGQIGR